MRALACLLCCALPAQAVRYGQHPTAPTPSVSTRLYIADGANDKMAPSEYVPAASSREYRLQVARTRGLQAVEALVRQGTGRLAAELEVGFNIMKRDGIELAILVSSMGMLTHHATCVKGQARGFSCSGTQMNRLIGILLWTFEQTILGHNSELLVPAIAIPLAAEFVNKMTEMKFIKDDGLGFPHQNRGSMANVVAPLQAILLSIMIAYSDEASLNEANEYSIEMGFGPLQKAACAWGAFDVAFAIMGFREDMIGNKHLYDEVAEPLHDDFFQQLRTFMVQVSCLMAFAAMGTSRVAFRFLSTTIPRRTSPWLIIPAASMALVANMATSDGRPLGVSIENFDRLRQTSEGMAAYLLGTFVRQMYDMAGGIPNVADLVRRTGAWGDHEAAMNALLRMVSQRHAGLERRVRDFWYWWWLSLFGGITFGVTLIGPRVEGRGAGGRVLQAADTGVAEHWDPEARAWVTTATPYPDVPYVADGFGDAPRRVADLEPRIDLGDQSHPDVAAAVDSMGPYADPANDNPRHGPEGLGGRGSALRHQIRTVEAGVQPSSRLYER